MLSRINGWLFVDKPIGVTSRFIIDIISSVIKNHKVGHAGTLDPLASGLLAIAIGEATKTVFVVQEMKKNMFLKLNGENQLLLTTLKE